MCSQTVDYTNKGLSDKLVYVINVGYPVYTILHQSKFSFSVCCTYDSSVLKNHQDPCFLAIHLHVPPCSAPVPTCSSKKWHSFTGHKDSFRFSFRKLDWVKWLMRLTCSCEDASLVTRVLMSSAHAAPPLHRNRLQ